MLVKLVKTASATKQLMQTAKFPAVEKSFLHI
jgi:hypothetical protein